MKQLLLRIPLFLLYAFVGKLSANCPTIVAAFTATPTNVCGPGFTPVSFTNTSTGAGVGAGTFEWYRNGVLFDNTSGASAPINSSVNAVGSYTFMLIASNAANTCTDTAIVIVTVWPIPVASFTFTPNNQCAALPVQFTNTSTGTTAGTTYLWNFGDATTSTAPNPSHTYAAGGTYNVTLTVTNFIGCSSTFTLTVTALTIPAVSISGNDGDGDTQNCLLPGDPTTSEVVAFSNTTTGAVSYTWDFGDGSPVYNTASNATFNHTYNTYGTYTVTMTAVGPNGCTATATLVVIFERYVGASFSVPIAQMSGCLPLTVTPVNASQNATTYSWNFGDGSPVVVTTNPVPPAHTYTVSGTYTITLTASNSCNSSVSTVSPIIVVGPPVVNFNATPNPGCSPQLVTFTNLSTGVSPANNYTWNFGNGNIVTGTGNPPPQTYTQGTWTIMLIAGSACGTDTMFRTIVVDTLPDVNLFVNPTNGCSPLTVTTNNTSTGGSLTYQWYIDNILTSTAVNIAPVVFTAPPGNNVAVHTIRLVVSNHCGTRDSLVTITVHPAVQAIFTPLTSTICQGGNVTFSQSSYGDNLTYQWDFGNGNTSTISGPHTQSYNVAGTFTVSLIVNGYCGADTQLAIITVNPMPVAGIQSVPLSGCEDLLVNFTNNSTIGGTYTWNFGPGAIPATSTLYTPPAVLFPNAGTQTVTITVNLLGCISTDTLTLSVFPRPVPSFSALPTSGCTPLSVTFNNTTTVVVGNTYSWDFGNGNTSAAQNPPGQTYLAGSNDSIYTIELVVMNSYGCADSVTHTITVHPLPVASFTMNTDTVCALTNIQFTNTSTGICTYAWNFGDATTSTATNPIHPYAASGNYTVQLIATTSFGCTDTITAPVFVDPVPATAFTASIECLGDSTLFFNTTTGNVVSWAWNFGDATSSTVQNPSHLYTNAGSYNVTLTATNTAGCSIFFTQTVIVNLVPVASFANTTVCLGQATTFTDQTTPSPISWNWNYGDATATGSSQNPSHTYSTAGTYSVTLIAAAGSGCADTIVQSVIVNPVPTASFTFVSACANDTVLFSSTSLGNPTTFFWNFGDAQTDNTNNPSPVHTYSLSGTYNVTLTAGYATGCTNSIVIPVQVYPRTVPSFTSNIPCLGGATNFSDATTNNPTNWSWDFGDASPLNTTPNPSHTYGSAGTYTVTLVTQNSFGCIDSVSIPITVYPLPVASFIADTVCAGAASSFTDLSSSAVAWSWDFGDATSLNVQQSPSHTYGSQGTYTVTLVVWNAQGCTDTISIPIIVNPNPVSAFNATVACHTYPTQFTDLSSSAVGWQWNFGDASPINNSTSPAYTYATPGSYTTTLVVTNIFGCTDTSNQVVNVLPQPQAGFTSTTVCAREVVTFLDTTTGLPTQWTWDFGDGSPLVNSQNPTHVYTLGGNYVITLIAGNNAGCIDTLFENITVNTVPTPLFSATSVCLGNITAFTDLSTDSVVITNYYWDFGDGNNSFAQNPNYIYQAPGTYTVSLTVTNVNGCDSTFSFPVTVTGIPIAAFTYDTVCVGSATNFMDISTGSPSSWLWDFGDATTSTNGPAETHVYAASGTYLVSLIVSGGSGCTDQAFHIVTVSNSVVSGMTVIDSTCLNTSVVFTDNSVITIGTISGSAWDFGDGSPIDTNLNTSHNYSVAGTYTISHTVSTNSGCTSVSYQTIVVSPLPVASFTASTACENQSTLFTDNSSGTPTSWQWDFGDATTSSVQNPVHTYASSGLYNASLIITSAAGCTDTAGLPVTVFAQPIAAFSTNMVCFGDTTLFTDLSSSSSGSLIAWNWDFGDGDTSNLSDPVHSFVLVNDSFYVTLIVQNTEGCSDTVSQLVLTYPIPDMNFVPSSASGCEEFTTQFFDSSTVNNGTIVNWLWDFGDGNFQFGSQPVHTYDSAGTYIVSLTVTSSYGCSYTDTLNYPIIVYPKPVADFTAVPWSVSILTPHVDFTDESQGSLFWQWDFGDYNTSIVQDPSHDYTDTGSYTVTQVVFNQYGCSDTTTRIVEIKSEYQFFIPNAFTPNGNGNNETFIGEGIGIMEFEMLIFDRWGNLIFESHDQNMGWNGKLANGQMAEIDVYVYRFSIRDVLGEEHRYIGHLSLIR